MDIQALLDKMGLELPIAVVMAVLFCLMALSLLNWRWKVFKSRWLERRRFARGQRLEREAAKVLRNWGYDIVAEQQEYAHEYYQDGILKKARIIIDYYVEKDGYQYVVEVKTGNSAVRTENSSTRRQLLEYYTAIPCDGILLLDMESGEMSEVHFDAIAYQNREVRGRYRFLILLSLSWILVPSEWVRWGGAAALILIWIWIERAISKAE